jgi:SAM-dependent methyltransferase
MSVQLSHIHPFPARMASEIAFECLADLPIGAVVLDPMSGSGTVLRVATEMGHRGIGFDLDPLAVLMARAWTTYVDGTAIVEAAIKIVDKARLVGDVVLPWVHSCEETIGYIKYWFERKQADQLQKLSFVLSHISGPISDVLRIALSRIIVTKERGASIARDASHSRPHRVFFDNDYDVFDGFLRSATRLADRLGEEKLKGSTVVNVGDARRIDLVPRSSVDAVITSPPYLNAIDYLRGHRLSLVWLGYSVKVLRKVRASSIGTEVANWNHNGKMRPLLREAGPLHKLPSRELRMVERYASDILSVMTEIYRVLKPGGQAVLVIGNSRLKEVTISNAAVNIAAANTVGLRLECVSERELLPANRYLPPPSGRDREALSKRMKTETVLVSAA